jgi:hypothetical protein
MYAIYSYKETYVYLFNKMRDNIHHNNPTKSCKHLGLRPKTLNVAERSKESKKTMKNKEQIQ